MLCVIRRAARHGTGRPKQRRIEDLRRSTLTESLIEKVADGEVHISTACDLAYDATADGADRDSLRVMKHMATKNNQERQFHAWTQGGLYGVQLEPYWLDVDVYDVETKSVRSTPMPALAPYEVFHELHRAGPAQFRVSCLGTGSLVDFWNHVRGLEWVQKHPHVRPDLYAKLVPIEYHYDGAEMFRASENLVWSWGSALTSGAVQDVKFVMFQAPCYCFPTRELQDRLHAKIADFVAWCQNVAFAGVFPTHGFKGEDWESS